MKAVRSFVVVVAWAALLARGAHAQSPVRAATPAVTTPAVAAPARKTVVPAAEPTVAFTLPFALYAAAPTQLAIPLNRAGQVTIDAKWTGPEQVVQLTSPAGVSTEVRGTGSATLTRVLTPADAAAKGMWTVTLRSPTTVPEMKKTLAQRAGAGTITVTAPAPEPVAAEASFASIRRGAASGALAQRLTAPAATPPVPPMPASGTAPPSELLGILQRAYPSKVARELPIKRLPAGSAPATPPAPRIDRITLCQPDFYGGPFHDVDTIENPLGWVLLHGANFAGGNTDVLSYPYAGNTSDVRVSDPYTGPPTGDSLLVVCVMAGSNCHVGSSGQGAFSVRVNGQESNRVPFRFPGMERFYYVLNPQRPSDYRLGGDGGVTSSGGKWDQDPSLSPWGFQWPSNTTAGDSYRSEEMREFWESFIVWHNDIPTEHSKTVLGQTVKWKTSSSDRGTDEFFVGTTLPQQFRVLEVRVTPVVDQFSDLFGFANDAGLQERSSNASFRVNWWRAPGVSLVYRVQLLVSGPQYCSPEGKLQRP